MVRCDGGRRRSSREAAREAARTDPTAVWHEFKTTQRALKERQKDAEKARGEEKAKAVLDIAHLKERLHGPRNTLLEHYMALVRYTAERLFAKLPQNVELDDLVSSGVFGLKDAIEGFDLGRGIKFETYATTRIRGAILDELRAFDWVPRLVRTKGHKIESATRAAEVELGRIPNDVELMGKLGLTTMDELRTFMKDGTAVTIASLSDCLQSDDDEGKQLRKIDVLEDRRQEKPIDFAGRKDLVLRIMQCLTKKERDILGLYYFHELTMREIGLTLDLSESRVCQLHTRMMEKLRETLRPKKADLLT